MSGDDSLTQSPLIHPYLTENSPPTPSVYKPSTWQVLSTPGQCLHDICMSSSQNQMCLQAVSVTIHLCVSLCSLFFWSVPLCYRHISVLIPLQPRSSCAALRGRCPLPSHGSGAAEPPRSAAGTPVLPRLRPALHELHGVLPQVRSSVCVKRLPVWWAGRTFGGFGLSDTI